MSNSPTQSFVFYGDGAAQNKSVVAAIRTGLVIGAVLAAIVAVLIFSWPGVLPTIAVIFGIYVLVRGIIRFTAGIFAPGLTGPGRTLSIILGVLLVAASIFMLRNLDSTIAVIGLLIGLAWIIDGIATVVESSRDRSRGVSLVAGIISILAGVVFLFIPSDGVLFLTYFTGAVFALLAILQLVGAFMVGRARR